MTDSSISSHSTLSSSSLSLPSPTTTTITTTTTMTTSTSTITTTITSTIPSEHAFCSLDTASSATVPWNSTQLQSILNRVNESDFGHPPGTLSSLLFELVPFTTHFQETQSCFLQALNFNTILTNYKQDIQTILKRTPRSVLSILLNSSSSSSVTESNLNEKDPSSLLLQYLQKKMDLPKYQTQFFQLLDTQHEKSLGLDKDLSLMLEEAIQLVENKLKQEQNQVQKEEVNKNENKK